MNRAKTIFVFGILGAMLLFSNCDFDPYCYFSGHDELDTVRIDKRNVFWRPPLDSIIITYKDTQNNELKFNSLGLRKEYNSEEGGYFYSCSTWSGIFETKILTYQTFDSSYKIIYKIEPSHSDDELFKYPYWTVEIYKSDKNKIIDKISTSLYDYVHGFMSFQNIEINGKKYSNVYVDGGIYFKENMGVIGFKDNNSKLWVIE